MVAENDEMGDHLNDDHLNDDHLDDDYLGGSSSDDEAWSEDGLEGEKFEDDQEFEDDVRSSKKRKSRSKKKRRMFCGGCNRMENHRRAARKSWLNSYITGLTFGLNRLVGPFKCTCCGSNRWGISFKKSNAVIIKK